MSEQSFRGFPGLARATVIPNLYFATLLPAIDDPAELLAFLWAAHLVQEKVGDLRFVTEAEILARPEARRSIARLGGGPEGLRRGLEAAVRSGALLGLRLKGDDGEEGVYLINNPASRRLVLRARAGEVALKPRTVAVEIAAVERPGIFSLYEHHIGTITPFVGERLLAAAERYPAELVEAAFREAAELNVRNWRYIERMLERWEREGRDDGEGRGDSLEERKRRFLAPSRDRTRG